jgi:predicted Zn-dependent protease
MRPSVVVCLGLLVATAAQAQDDVVGRAMRDELARTMGSLRLNQLERPYFVSYSVEQEESVQATASYGSLLSSGASRGPRQLSVEVRVGDYAFDNTNAIAMGRFGGFGLSMRTLEGSNTLPRDDNYREIRRRIWLSTDGAYKVALEELAAKRAALLNRTRSTPLADFSHETPTHTTDTTSSAPVDRAAVEDLARALSRVATSPTVYGSRVTVSSMTSRQRYINSEGTEYVVARPLVMVTARASMQATDGARLFDEIEFYARRFDGLPPRDELTTRVRAMLARLDSLRTAPVLERYNGPVLFIGQAAGDLFANAFAFALIGQRPYVIDNPQAEAMMSEMMRGSSFADKLGGRVLPEFMRVVDDPTAMIANGVPLFGGYAVDVEGVRARPTVVVDSGVLKTLLTSRQPVDGVDHSTGNRRGWGTEPSNLIVSATNGVTDSALVQQMLALVKRRGLPYGVIVRALAQPSSDITEMMSSIEPDRAGRQRIGAMGAYRIYPDGHEELVRGASLTEFGTSDFKDIIAVSNTPTVLTAGGMPVAIGGSGRSMMMSEFDFDSDYGVPVSLVVPSLLFDDLSLAARPGARPSPPISAPPT